MIYTEYGLKLTIEDLKRLLERVKNAHEYENMEGCIYIKGGERPTITQYCSYAECSPKNYTYNVPIESK